MLLLAASMSSSCSALSSRPCCMQSASIHAAAKVLLETSGISLTFLAAYEMMEMMQHSKTE